MTHLDLFSGIGGFALAFGRHGFTTVAFSEIDPFACAVLAHHWPEVPNLGDINQIHGNEILERFGAIDVLTGGFPCQPFSSASAGKQRGTADHRYLWPQMCRVVAEVQPTWVLGENVALFGQGVVVEQVVSDLEASGYEVAPPFEIPACAVGFDHRRTRYWILGHANRDREPNRAFDAETPRLSPSHRDAGELGSSHGVSSRLDRLAALGNAVVPALAEVFARSIVNLEHR